MELRNSIIPIRINCICESIPFSDKKFLNSSFIDLPKLKNTMVASATLWTMQK